MNKNGNKYITFLSRGFSTRTMLVRYFRESRLALRLTALLLMTALLAPVIFFNPSPAVAAASSFSASAPIAAPPEIFAASSSFSTVYDNAFIGGAISTIMAANGKLAKGYESAANVIAPPALPEGFENAVLPTFSERLGNAFSSPTVTSPASSKAIFPVTTNSETEESDVSSETVATIGTGEAEPNGNLKSEVPSAKRSNDLNEMNTVTNSEVNPEPPAVAPLAPPTTCPTKVQFDFDCDGKADVARFQSSSNLWTIKKSSGGGSLTLTTGATGSIIAPGDYDGDGDADCAVWNQYSADWTIKDCVNNTLQQTITAFGLNGDVPVSADYDNDGITDAALFRPSTGTWYVRQSSNSQVVSTGWGQSGDVPVPADYNGDGYVDLAVFRAVGNIGYWYILIPGNGGYYTYFQWGGADVPAPADYDGDGKADYAVYRPSNGTWYIQPINNNSYISKTWGNYGDQPVPADYDGDGKADIAVWRPTSGVWYIVKSLVPGMTTYLYDQLGIPGDTAVSSAYVNKVGGAVPPSYLAMARLSPKNATGGTNVYSQNFSWGTSLVNLPGRAGLDAGFGISYNSLVWTKVPYTTPNTMVFDADYSNVSPGFRFGFPVIEPSYYNPLTQQFSYLMVTPSGSRVEFRQTAASNVYETADSSYAQLTVIPGQQNLGTEYSTLLVRTTDGTMMTYSWRAGSYKLSEIKDHNGNYISVVHDTQNGLLQSMTDTLGRVITVEYDSDFSPIAIKQDWKDNNGAGSTVSHTYATFTYTSKTITPHFNPVLNMNVFGPTNGTYVKVLEQIVYPTGGRTVFEYNDYGQVKKVRNLAANFDELNYVETNLADYDANSSATPDDGPRLSETRNWVKNFNNNQATVIHNSFTSNATYSANSESLTPVDMTEVWMDNDPHSVHSKTYYHAAGNWAEGLPLGTIDIADNAQKRWTRTVWTQDDTSKNYKVNPRVEETKVGDTANTKRTTMNYWMQTGSTTASQFGLVKEVRAFDSNQTTVLKKSFVNYKIDQTADAAYLNRRIIGLPKEQMLYEGESTLMSMVKYDYDAGNFNDTNFQQDLTSVIRHDNTNYGANLTVGRGNLTSATRCETPTSVSGTCVNGITSDIKYNTSGAVVAQINPLGRTAKIGYEDSFNDTTSTRNTYAYPTKMTEIAYAGASSNFSTVKYRFDTGANVRAVSPAPNNATGDGKISERIFDSFGRLERERVIKDNTEHNYTRYEYPTNQIQSKIYTVVNAGAGEVLSESWTDGEGRVRQSKTEFPGVNTTGWSGSLVEYDILGRINRSSATMEFTVDSTGAWIPAGDDADYGGWLWSTNEYDWKGRVTRQINSDGTDKIISYQGCGCAGNQVTTVYGEEIFETDWQGNNSTSLGRRTQKSYQDILGRTVKTQTMNFNGTSVYTTTDVAFNGRDQATTVTRSGSGTSLTQVTTMSYDEHGRLKTQHRPEQDANTATVYNYNTDDSISSVVDARGASTNYVYNTRGLLDKVFYTAPVAADPGNQIRVPATVNFTYDALGNRLTMTEDTSTAAGAINEIMNTSYSYDSLSRLASETQSFNDTDTGFNQSFTFNYQYNLAGQLTEFSDPNELSRGISYERDKIGRVVSVKNNQTNAFGGVQDYATNIQYRAFGAVKSMIYPGTQNMQLSQTFNNRLQLEQFNVNGDNWNNPVNRIGSINKYYADGRIKSAADLYNNKFDRWYKYDLVGRIAEAKTGIEARDPQATSSDRPYRQTYGFNAFNNLTNRTGLVWDMGADTVNNSYTNNRNDNQYWSYDADGRNKIGDYTYNKYDAAGRRFKVENDFIVEQTFNGDGQRVKQTEDDGNTGVSLKKRYYIQSNVLGTVYEIEKSGTNWVKRTGMVYLNGQRIALQNLSNNNTTKSVWWIYENPVTGATRGSIQRLASEPDPVGINIGLTAPPPRYEGGGEGVPDIILPRFADAFNLNSGCTIDGMAASCDLASMALDLLSQSYNPQPKKKTEEFVDSPLINVPSPGAFADHSSVLARSGTSGGSSPGPTFIASPFGGTNKSPNLASPQLPPEHVEVRGHNKLLPEIHLSVTPWNYSMKREPLKYPKIPLKPAEIQSMRETFLDGLTDDCFNFINTLVRQQTGNESFDAKTDLLKTFDRVRDSAKDSGPGFGFNWGGIFPGAGAIAGKGWVGVNNATINMGTSITNVVLIHELIHVVTRHNDGDLSETVNKLGITVYNQNGTVKSYPGYTGDPLVNAGYWGQALLNKCGYGDHTYSIVW